MKNQGLLLFVFLVILTSCSKEYELQKSVFISDIEFPELPEYSEWGYNTFGAYYDRDVFVSNSIDIPLKILVINDTTSFIFHGQNGSSDYYNSSNEMIMKFSIPDFSPGNYSDLLVLNDTIIDLKKSGSKLIITINDNVYESIILNGIIEFKRAQELFVDTKQIEVILSGFFEFQAIVNNIPISVTMGRFDIGVGANIFFSY